MGVSKMDSENCNEMRKNKQIEKFNYLKSVRIDRKCDTNIQRCIEVAKVAYQKLINI